MSTSFKPLKQRCIAQLGSKDYLVRDRVEYGMPLRIPLPASSPLPVVVVNIDVRPVPLDRITETLRRFELEDDVFDERFTTGGLLIIQQAPDILINSSLPSDVIEYLDARATTVLHLSTTLPEGPYFAVGREVHQAWRLYPDELSAFTTSVLPDDEDITDNAQKTKFIPFRTSAFTDSSSFIPVPSRLYFKKSPTLPLAGLRLTVKDNMHLSGTVTSLGNRSYTRLYGTRPTTAAFIDTLTSKGAIIIGKTKLSAFAGSEIPPSQCIDYFPPWNARGDGYQGPSGSSSGAASCVAGYEWVDGSVCTDTTGSLRFPASSHGVWGHRVTWGAVDMTGVVPPVPMFDSMGLMTRTPEIMSELLSATGLSKSNKTPKRIFYPTDWYPLQNAPQQAMTSLFLSALESFLDIKRTPISLIDEWSRTAPEEYHDTSLPEFLGTSAISVNAYHVYHSLSSFRREYPKKFGEEPYVSPAHRARWDRGSRISHEDCDESLHRIQIFKTWMNEEIWKPDDRDNVAIMVVPHGRPGANYRDAVAEPAGGPSKNSYTSLFTTSMLGCPQLVVPIGQNPYDSRVSGRVEYAPIVTTLIEPSYCDNVLAEVATGALDGPRMF